MESINSISNSKSNLLNDKYDKNEHFPWNISNSFCIKDFKENDNILLSINNEFTNKEFNSIDLFHSLGKEEESQENEESLKSDKETLLNSKKIYSKDLNKSNEDDTKRQLKLKRNRESAKNGRLRKKEFIQNLIAEYNKLKIKYKKLLNIMHKCPKCDKLLLKEENKEKYIESLNEPKNNLLNESNGISNKKKFLFTTAIAIISIINIFNIPLNIINYYKYNDNYIKNDYLRNLNSYQNFTYEDNKNYLLNKLNSSNDDNEALYIHFSEYYSLTKREKIIDKQLDLKKELNKNIKVFQENQINIDQISHSNARKCVKCVVEIDKKSIKMGGDEFTFYLAHRYLSKFFSNNNEDGIFPKINFEENKNNSFNKIFALKCKILSYSINDLYSGKLENF